METQLYQTLNRIENKVDTLTEKLNAYSIDCSSERTSFDGRIKSLEGSVNFAKGKLFMILEKFLIWGIAVYFGGKELIAQIK